ncbi:curli production assembly/transport component CsgF [Spirosoma endbachense]|uniref:Curli production assembly/transport component CsgF n=1 Tax=Spirosoma endbachense TaxID=2666025 RepID=A0A6P1VSE3_9BACT|nr:curli production assembly/transport component CsgF [Spirosoma endbachense]QHV95534.1 curli production assembly protein CsgF [Spirosoma endbachense]
MVRSLPICFLLLLSLAGQAQSFVYHPNNPSFGGNTFNYAWMLSSAQAQDKLKDPSTPKATTSSSTQNSALTSFSQTLQNQLLSQLSRNLFTSQFGEQGLKEGTFQFGDLQVIVANGTDGINIQITDGKGGQTTITVPYF